jgi:hypothetical protein
MQADVSTDGLGKKGFGIETVRSFRMIQRVTRMNISGNFISFF